jgi:signal transduction histidine kinase
VVQSASTTADLQPAERALRAANMTLTSVFESLRDGALIRDLNGQLVRMNSAYLRVMRYRSRAECEQPPREIERLYRVTDPEGRLLPMDAWPTQRAARGEAGATMTLVLERTDVPGRWVCEFSYAPVLDAFGAVVGSVITVRDVTVSHQLQEELLDSRLALRELLAARDRAQDEERMRIARELHDDLQQRLSALKLDLRHIMSQPPSACGPDLQRLDEGLQGLIESVREVVQGLHPGMLEQLGLPAAMEALVSGFSQRTGIGSDFHCVGCDEGDPVWTADVERCLYRVVQECLNNVHKHAHASFVLVCLDVSDPTAVVVQVVDDGVGIGDEPVRPAPGGWGSTGRGPRGALGMLGMRERLLALGGTLTVSNRNPGTEVLARVPIPHHTGS